VERSQDAHGVLPDGMVGPGMRRLLNGRQKTSVPKAQPRSEPS
jgi:hypothetical protein